MRNAVNFDPSEEESPSDGTKFEVEKSARRTTARAVALSCIEFLFQKASGGSNKAEELLAGCAHDLQTLASTQAASGDLD